MSRVALEALGCKLNQAEMEHLADHLLSRGHILVDSAEAADIYVLNTCTVTHVADRKSRQALRTARQGNPTVTVIATGCYARRAPEELVRLGVVDIVLDTTELDPLIRAINHSGSTGDTALTGNGRGNWNRTRSLVKVQEGCNHFCSFCVVPHVRGNDRSRPLEEILGEVKGRLTGGYREIVLTGTKLGGYHQDGHATAGLIDLVKHILDETNVERLRLSSLLPRDLTPEMIRLWQDERLCPHLHLPLQSGCETILRRMGRPYSIHQYEEAMQRARDAIPDLSITTDVLVGFPGEGEDEFEQSYHFCERAGFAGIHVFTYSKRPGTAAAVMDGHVDEKTKKKRSALMLTLARETAARFQAQFLGRTMAVLWEQRTNDGLWSGYTANYIRVLAKSKRGLTGRILPARLTVQHDDGLFGEIVDGGHNG